MGGTVDVEGSNQNYGAYMSANVRFLDYGDHFTYQSGTSRLLIYLPEVKKDISFFDNGYNMINLLVHEQQDFLDAEEDIDKFVYHSRLKTGFNEINPIRMQMDHDSWSEADAAYRRFIKDYLFQSIYRYLDHKKSKK